MKKHLAAYGNTWQFYISKPIAQMLGLTVNEYTVNLTIENKILYIKKIPNAKLNEYQDLLCKKLIRRSSGYGLNIPIPILEILDINPENDMVDFCIEENVLIIKKAI